MTNEIEDPESIGSELLSPEMKSLRNGRALALQILYETDLTSHNWRTSLAHYARQRRYKKSIVQFAERMIDGVLSNIESLDAEIVRFAPNYPVQQLSVVDRNVLRLALHEIHRDSETPLKVIINEAIEIAKTFGSEASYKFVNGVLGSFSDDSNNAKT